VKRIAILGSTGSIGQSALAVVDAYRDRLAVVGLAARENADRLAEQVARYAPRIAALSTPAASARLRALAPGCVVAPPGPEGLVAVASHPEVDLVLCATSGTDGLEAVLAAIEERKTIALANKEVLVMAGGIVTEAARRHGVDILPVDSEHNAIHQCLRGREGAELKRLVLTASGGPFRGRSAADLAGVTAAKTVLPVLGVPMESKSLHGIDSLLSMVQMPAGVPVGTLAIGKAGAVNAALLATAILGNKHPEFRAAYEAFRRAQTEKGLANQEIQTV